MYINYLKELVKDKKICIFPMGIAGKSLIDKLESISIKADYFCDNNPDKVGSEYKGLRCISKDELRSVNNETIIIVESLYYRSIKEQLVEEGYKNIERIYFEKITGEEFIKNNREEYIQKSEKVKKILEDEKSKRIYEHIIDAYEKDMLEDDYFYEIYEGDQYFEKEIVQLTDKDVFVDLGAYIGDSAEEFIKNVHGRYEKMHLFELDPTIYRRLMMNIPMLYDKTEKGLIQCYPYGASDVTSEVVMSEGDSSSKIISGKDKTGVIGKVRRLDDVLKDERVTFIKADIEGAELSALQGAKEIICSQKPVLAICIYHSVSDTINIPLWIKQTVPEYRIYIRHHTDLMLETVCYAIP